MKSFTTWLIIVLVIGISSCSNNETTAHDISYERTSTGIDTIIILDTTWAAMSFEVYGLHFYDTTQDKILLIADDSISIELKIYDASNLRKPDCAPLIIFGPDSTYKSNFIILSDSLAVLALRTNGLTRPEAMVLVKENDSSIKLIHDPESVLKGQVQYVAYLENERQFLLHTSGLQEDSIDGLYYKRNSLYKVQDQKFELIKSIRVPSGEERLFLDGDFNSNSEYYGSVYSDYIE